MAGPARKGNRRRRLFPKVLWSPFAALTPPSESNASGASESAFQQGLYALVEFLKRLFALDHLAINEKGRRRTDLQHLGCELLIGGDLVEQRLVLEAFLDRLLAQSGLQANPGQRLGGVLDHPVVLLLEQHVDNREIFAGIILGDAARQHRAGGGLDVERELAEHEADLAAVDIFRLD